MGKVTLQFLLLTLIFLCLPRSSGAAVTLLEKDDWKFQASGFVELDMFADSTRSLTEVAGSNPIDRPSSYAGDNGRSQFSIRNSRLAFSVLPPQQNEWKTKGYLEFDLLGYNPPVSATGLTNSEASFYSNPTLRVRHAYLSAEKEGWQILAGQYWTLFGWVPTYVLTTASVPPVTGTLYERTPQLTVIKTLRLSELDKLQGGVSLSRPVERDSEVPNLDAGVKISFGGRRAGYSSPSGDTKAEPLSVALTGTAREFLTPNPSGTTADSTRFIGGAVALGAMIPILSSDEEKDYGNTLSLAGEFSTGTGYGDQFPSWNGNLPQLPSSNPPPGSPNLDPGQGGIDASGNFQLVHLQSINGQLQYHLPQGWESFVTAGYSQVMSNNVSQLTGVPTGKIAYDRTEACFLNFFHDFTKQIRVAAEYDRFLTHYVNSDYPSDSRYQISAWFRF